MARSLYRIYLYGVYVIMLGFVAGGLGVVVTALAGQTPLIGTNTGFPTTPITQSLVLAGALWIVPGALAVLHRWLIGRDLQTSDAGSGAVRAFFLNVAEAISALVAITSLIAVFDALGQTAFRANVTGGVGAGVATLALVALLDWERRARPRLGAAITFERLHLYGLPFIVLLFIAPFQWSSAINATKDAVYCATVAPACMLRFSIQPESPAWLWVGALWVALVLVVYVLLARGDSTSVQRQGIHLLSLAVGLSYLIAGIEQGIEVVLQALFLDGATLTNPQGQLSFLAPLLFGLVVLVGYGLLVGAEAPRLPMGAQGTGLAVQAIAMLLFAVPFWVGIGMLLHTGVEALANPSVPVQASDWRAGAAFVLTGASYIPLALRLRQRTMLGAARGPRRAVVLALLAGGTISAAIGLVIVLYSLGSSLFGFPIANWQALARSGGVVAVIGALLGGYYLRAAAQERFLQASVLPSAAASAPAVPAPALAAEVPPAPPTQPATIEAVLDALLAGSLTRDEAAARLRDATKP